MSTKPQRRDRVLRRAGRVAATAAVEYTDAAYGERVKTLEAQAGMQWVAIGAALLLAVAALVIAIVR